MRRLDSIRQIYYRGLLRSCNYTCSYCPFGRKSPSGPTSRDEQAWRRFVAAMEAWRSPVRLFLIPYGEALVHAYYREAVEELGLNMKPWQYELNVEAREDEAALLRDYLNKHSIPGEQVELWNLWVGEDRGETVPCYRGRLADLDSHALDLLCNPPMEQDGPGQCRMIVTI